MKYNSSEHTISWFRNQYRDGNLKIKPPYQRKPVWAARQKSYLVESILLEYPVPEVYIQLTTTPEGDETYSIVDGQQRIRTVLQFVGAESDPEEAEHNKFTLDKLANDSPYKNMTFGELTDEMKSKFFGYKFAVRYIRTDSDAEVREMFARLNKYLTPLKAQELRNAIYGGPFVRLASKLADDEFWAENRIVTPASIRRMGDIEFVSELLIGVLHGPQGGASRVIDDYYNQFEDYEEEFPEQRKTSRLFKETLDLLQRTLTDLKNSRWSNKTDFYTIFVTVANLLRSKKFVGTDQQFDQALIRFANEISLRLRDEEAQVSREAIQYVRAVEKGANDKARRAERNAALSTIIGTFFD